MTRRGVPILMYHQVMPQRVAGFRKYTVTARAFRAQMSYLRRAGYAPVSMSDLLDFHTNNGRLPQRPVVITFDDGFQGCLDHAVPVLERFGFTAIFYIVSNLVGKSSKWLVAEKGIE